MLIHLIQNIEIEHFRIEVYRFDHPYFGWSLSIIDTINHAQMSIDSKCEVLIKKEFNKYIFLIDQKIMERI